MTLPHDIGTPVEPAPQELYKVDGEVYTVHAAATVFPLLVGEPFEALRENVRANGLLEPVYVRNREILDGRNRLKVCLELDVPVRFEQVPDLVTPASFVWSKNGTRRHLTTSQLAMHLAQLMQLEECADASPASPAVQPVRDSDGHPGAGRAASPARQPPRLPQASSPAVDGPSPPAPLTLDRAAKESPVGRRTIARAKSVLKAAPELAKPVRVGTITVADADAISDSPREIREQAVRDVEAGRARTAADAVRHRPDQSPSAPSETAAASRVSVPVAEAESARQLPAPDPDQPFVAANIYTVPQAVVRAVQTAFGKIDLAFSSGSDENDVWPARKRHDPTNVDFKQPWSGCVVIAPPQNCLESLESLVRKLMSEIDAHRVSSAAVFAPLDLAQPWCDLLLGTEHLSIIAIEKCDPTIPVAGFTSTARPRAALFLLDITNPTSDLVETLESWGHPLSSGKHSRMDETLSRTKRMAATAKQFVAKLVGDN